MLQGILIPPFVDLTMRMKISPFWLYLIKSQQEEDETREEYQLQAKESHTFQPILPLVWFKPASRTMMKCFWSQGSGWCWCRHTSPCQSTWWIFFVEVKILVDAWIDTPWSYKMLMRACDEGSLQERMDVILGPQKIWLQTNDNSPTNHAATNMAHSMR